MFWPLVLRVTQANELQDQGICKRVKQRRDVCTKTGLAGSKRKDVYESMVGGQTELW